MCLLFKSIGFNHTLKYFVELSFLHNKNSIQALKKQKSQSACVKPSGFDQYFVKRKGCILFFVKHSVFKKSGQT